MIDPDSLPPHVLAARDRKPALNDPRPRRDNSVIGQPAYFEGLKTPPKKNRKTGEAAMQDEIESFCRVKGWPCYRSRMDRKSTMPAGTPDFMICVPNRIHEGLFVAIECKLKPNTVTEDQKRELNAILSAGGFAIVAWSSKEAIDHLIYVSKL